jgi:hypothetical protein
MKKLNLLLLSVLFIVSAFAQAPEKMSFQAVVRDQNGTLKTNSLIGVQIIITKDGGFFPQTVYTETHTTTSNANGLITLEVGNGTVVNGDFPSIDWGSGSYSLKTNYDLSGGTNYGLLGSSKLLSVPYALYAKNAGNTSATGSCPDGTSIGELKYWNGTEWISIAPALEGQVLTMGNNNTPVWQNNSYTPSLASVATSSAKGDIGKVTIEGIVTSGSGSHVYERGICYITNMQRDAVITDNRIVCGSGVGSFSATINDIGLTVHGDYYGEGIYARTYAINNAGVSYGQSISVSTIGYGSDYLGGMLVYVLKPSDIGYDPHVKHGLIKSKNQAYDNIVWGCNGTITNATNQELGGGKENTEKILQACTENEIAARICNTHGAGGYDDWYLPGIGDLLKVGPDFLSQSHYMSSTEVDNQYYKHLYVDGNKEKRINNREKISQSPEVKVVPFRSF